MTQLNPTPEPRPCLGYEATHRLENGVPCCMGCDKPIKDHPIEGRTMAPAPQPKAQEYAGKTRRVSSIDFGSHRRAKPNASAQPEPVAQERDFRADLMTILESRMIANKADREIVAPYLEAWADERAKTKNPAKDEVSGRQADNSDLAGVSPEQGAVPPILAQDGAQVEGVRERLFAILADQAPMVLKYSGHDSSTNEYEADGGWDGEMLYDTCDQIICVFERHIATATAQAYERGQADYLDYINGEVGNG